ncbi:MAG: acyl-CoA dehydratase activase [Chloroflexi bacterium]|nr:acyl-CoA dehydratase activase [Chloroflexota bacterium]
MKVYAGIDIGSLTAKVVLLTPSRTIGTYRVIQGRIVDEDSAILAFTQALDDLHLSKSDVEYIVTTGYGRDMINFGDKSITEITCHARGVRFVYPEASSVIDIGGQDSKVIVLDEEGGVANFAMNDKCAAGTGRFLDVMAHALNVPIEKMGELSRQSSNPASISSICTVFAESEVISLVANKRSRVDIIAGIHESIARRINSLTHQVKLKSPVIMSGGVAKNTGVVRALEKTLGVLIKVPPEPQIIGALGAALYAADSISEK